MLRRQSDKSLAGSLVGEGEASGNAGLHQAAEEFNKQGHRSYKEATLAWISEAKEGCGSLGRGHGILGRGMTASEVQR